MTIPWMHNCPHSDDSWCLDCVIAMGYETDALRAALAKEREDGAKLRAFAQECEKESRLVNDCIDPVEIRYDMKRRGLLDDNGNPTALLSGRGDGNGNE